MTWHNLKVNPQDLPSVSTVATSIAISEDVIIVCEDPYGKKYYFVSNLLSDETTTWWSAGPTGILYYPVVGWAYLDHFCEDE